MSKAKDASKVYAIGLAQCGIWLGIVSALFWLLPTWLFWGLAVVYFVGVIRQGQKRKAALLQMGGYLMAQGIHNQWTNIRFQQSLTRAPADDVCEYFDGYLSAISENPLGNNWTKRDRQEADKAMGDRR